MVLVDANILLLMLYPDASVRINDDSGKPIERAGERVEYLAECLSAEGEKVIIPTPVLAEALVYAGEDGPAYVAKIKKYACFEIVPFDELAAVELAQDHHRDKQKGDKRAGITAPWQRIKIDRQILAIAKVVGVDAIYCDDGPLRKLAAADGLNVCGIAELPLRPVEPQTRLNFGDEDGERPEAD
jgi:predicted nucleic acid-binding protein